MDNIEREAIRAEGYDPDDPIVLGALERIRLELTGLAAALRDAPLYGRAADAPRQALARVNRLSPGAV